MNTWGDLFTARQKVASSELATLCRTRPSQPLGECIGLAIGGVADRNVTLATWRPQADKEKVEHVFTRQALPMTWDFAEAVPLNESTGSFGDRVELVVRTISAMGAFSGTSGQVHSADATDHPLPDQAAGWA